MPQAFTIQVQGLDKLAQVFTRLPKVVQKEITNEFRATGQEWVNKAKADVPVDRARLKGSISYQATDTSLAIVAQNEIAAYQEFGTGKNVRVPESVREYAEQFRGSSESGVNPILALTEWVKRKHIAGTYSIRTHRRTGNRATQDAQNKRVAYLIFRKIKREGLKPKPFLFSGRNGEDRVMYYYERIKKNIAAVLSQIV